MRDLRRKLLSLGNHFFERLKTANFSTACGTSTLKSPPSRAFFVSDVHLRPRKHFSRCTLDCGFKTSESPALRGFEAERGPITGTSLYLVLLSNGLPYPKIWLKKFGFSPKTIPANVAKKLPPQRCSKPFFIALFNFSHKRPTFAFTSKNAYTLAFAQGIAHKRLQGETGAFPPRPQCTLVLPAKFLLVRHAFIYIHFPVLCDPHYIKSGRVAATNAVSNRFLSRFSTSLTNGPRSLSRVKVGTHSALGERSHTRAYTAKHGPFQMGALLLPSERFVRFGNPAWPGSRTANFAAFGSWSETLPKNTESLRNSDALMRVAVPRRRGPAGLRDPVSALLSMW